MNRLASCISFYYVQDVYQENQLRTRLDERPDIISGKASEANVNRVGGSAGGGSGSSQPSVGVLGTLRKFSGSNEHLDWPKINLNAAEIIYSVKV